jgi:hypothetical protein
MSRLSPRAEAIPAGRAAGRWRTQPRALASRRALPGARCLLPPRSLRHGPHISNVTRRLAHLAPGPRVRIAKHLTASIRSLTRQINQLEHEFEHLVDAHSPGLVAEMGVGTLTAATLIGAAAPCWRRVLF